MLNCRAIDPLVTPYVDGELPDADRENVAQHLRVCPPCYSRVAAERAVRSLIHACKPSLVSPCAPESLRARCADAARGALRLRAGGASAFAEATADRRSLGGGWSASLAEARLNRERAEAGGFRRTWGARVAPLAMAASLVLIVGGAFLYQVTDKSARVMAAELTADHVKCFAMNRLFDTRDAAPAVESSLLSAFGWQAHLPEEPARAGLELVGARPCLYGEGKIAHIMYRHLGRPVSLFMLPNASRSQELIQVLGHQAAIWCVGDRTFVLVSNEPKPEVEQMASFVQASLR